ncbi:MULTISPECIES: pantetheine-phosphate adenylyltransferase [Bacillota]|jgi:pantetheine-phosphate adenylyltransferase|uniref:Phosphopantetheine adenylyltransferase n=3 Tax=Erysipelotrichaceae TaxID=128827 RepID=A0A7G9GMX1_9FIRM|nr:MULTISPECIES: pantetheine-phosphate adenylyltransferase [Bacillota]QNM12153.1 pantetheine-phosphate adenylyltransferase [[Eubacterium] hominis]MCH4287362.1 pantetheine-phosphate adenylyltransferase [Amedibacillus hominis]RGB49488.1 pantetheine-phosphate adenylyltransferase [Absiella sp. AM22-9]RGB54964.1 pantetheine-phosphate adenylyltransferase [Absiella sp. AM10-20]RGB63748.1 pantetheine-phosphate adenylyltransferase [Absiella sp. AM09-45]
MKKAIFPGSFDPLTKGHLDIIERASRLFDELIVVILENSEKKTMFTQEERLRMLKNNTSHLNNVIVDADTSLTVTYAKQHGACAIIRGVRSVKDYEYELDIASANQYLNPEIETVLLFSSPAYAFVSSSIIREMMKYDVNIDALVSKDVKEALMEKYRKS